MNFLVFVYDLSFTSLSCILKSVLKPMISFINIPFKIGCFFYYNTYCQSMNASDHLS